MRVSNDITCEGDDDPLNSFTVTEIEYDLYGRPIRFAGSFVLRCTPGGQALTGSLDYTFDGNRGAPGFTPGNVLVTLDSIIYEYTVAGTQVQALPIGRGPNPDLFFGLHRRTGGSPYEPARDVAMTDDGILHLYNEQSNLGQSTFSDRKSRLSSLDPSGVWQHHALDEEWNASGIESALTVQYPYALALDQPTGGDARGIVRFDTAGGFAADRFDSGSTFLKNINTGLDGNVYVLEANGTTVDLFDPTTLAFTGSPITLAASVNAIAVDAAGRIFAVGGAQEMTVYEFDQTGAIQNSLDLNGTVQFGAVLTDIDVSSSGQIAMGLLNTARNDGEFVLSDTTLTSATLITIDPLPNQEVTYVGFAVAADRLFTDGFESGDLRAWSGQAGLLAGFLEVNGGAAKNGAYGLEVVLGAACSFPDDAVITSPPTITGTYGGCNTLIVSGVEVVAPGATLQAGSAVILGDSFAVATGAELAAGLDPTLLDGFPFVEDETPTAEDSYDARFDLNLDGATLDSVDYFELFVAYSSVGDEVFRLRVKRTASENRLVSAVRRDDGSYAETQMGEERLLPAGWNNVALEWRTGVDGGELLISINGSVFAGLTGVDNDTLVVDRVRLGVVDGSVGSSSGSIQLDNFNSWK
jgi:hypothetical protein